MIISNRLSPWRSSTSWWLRHEAALNWVALGLLLGAWNAASDRTPRPRPDALRAYGEVSVRAVHRVQPVP